VKCGKKTLWLLSTLCKDKQACQGAARQLQTWGQARESLPIYHQQAFFFHIPFQMLYLFIHYVKDESLHQSENLFFLSFVRFSKVLICVCIGSKQQKKPGKPRVTSRLLRFSKEPEGISCLSVAETQCIFAISELSMSSKIFFLNVNDFSISQCFISAIHMSSNEPKSFGKVLLEV